MMNYEQFQNEGLLNQLKNVFKEGPKEDDYIAVNILKYMKKNDILINFSATQNETIYKFTINRENNPSDPFREEDYIDDVTVSIIYSNKFKLSSNLKIKLNKEELKIKNDLKEQLYNSIILKYDLYRRNKLNTYNHILNKDDKSKSQ